MAPKSLAEQIAELEDVTPRDYDPEDIERGGNTSDEDDGPVKDADSGRGHYQAVGKGKLRNEDPVSLGKQYAGSRVSRDALMEESDDDDPFGLRSSDEGSEDDEEDEDEDISESEDERPAKLKAGGKKKKVEELDGMDTDGSEEDEDEDNIGDFDEDEDEDEDDSDEEGSDEDLDDDDDDDESEEDSDEASARPTLKAKSKSKLSKPSTSADDDRSELRALMATDQKSIAATLSAASKVDATKGKAVKQQRATFDALLNARIKLQKGLTASNQLATAEKGDVDSEALKSAESAALTLWSTLEELRLTLVDAQNPDSDENKKRKRPSPPTQATPTSTLWTRMTDLETPSLQHRRAILDKWSLKVRNSSGSTLANSKGKLLGSNAQQQTITAVLDAHVASETADLRAAKKARISSDPSSQDSVYIYDDTATYQSLLRDLVSQRMSSSDSITNGLDTLHLNMNILPSRTHHVTGMRKDKVKRDVDTRASKGRKMRFDVHEKLQNFMAPEDTGTWTGRAREEFFASLLGRSAAGFLGEDSDDGEGIGGGESEDEDAVEGGLRLFRG
ncbi:AATF family protein [Aspergillus stella-maris]|uniref:AATF family protein n=1 Tax=Aspergillus stella-maris TaxID=1810926 RepID=UPI003CCCA196